MILKRNKGRKAFNKDNRNRKKRAYKQQNVKIGDSESPRKEEISEEKLRIEYETHEKKEACIDGKPTNEYKEWRNARLKFDYLMLLGEKMVEEGDKKSLSKRELKKERVSKIAFEISKLFPHREIVASIDGKGGYAVHGWLQENYEDYEELIDNYVLDRACMYAKRYYKPEVMTSINELNLKDIEISKIHLVNEQEFENYPGLKFQQVLVIDQGRITNSLTWIPNYPYEIDAYDVRVRLGPANIGMIGFVLWNVLLVIVLHAPGKNQRFNDAKMEAKSLVKINDEIHKKIIHQYRTFQKPLQDKLDEITRDYLQAEKKYSDLMKKIETQVPSDILEEYHEMQFRTKKNKSSTNWKNILLIVLFIVIGGLMIYLIILFNNIGGMGIPTNSTISSSKLITNFRGFIS